MRRGDVQRDAGDASALACGVFLALLKKFRSALKAEIGVFFPTLVLKPLEVLNPKVPLAPYPQRRVLMALVRELCGDAEVLVDVFVNATATWTRATCTSAS